MSSDALTLGRTQLKRRRLPRPPKFTNWQKFIIVCDLTLVVGGLTSSALSAGLLMVGATAGIHATWMDALRRPFNAFPSHLSATVFLIAAAYAMLTGH